MPHKTAAARAAYAKQYRQTHPPKTYPSSWSQLSPERRLWWGAKGRARRGNILFTITQEDIVVPTHCPILGVPLSVGTTGNENSPSLDRIKPWLGYVKGNIQVISHRANRLKNDATFEEIEKLYHWMRWLTGGVS